MKNKPKLYRQGDVLLVEVEKVPAGAKKVGRDGGRVILAAGEVTGHHHAMSESGVALLEAGSERYLRVPAGGGTLRHEEHSTINVPPGDYAIVIQREYDDAQEFVRVRD